VLLFAPFALNKPYKAKIKTPKTVLSILASRFPSQKIEPNIVTQKG